MMGEVLLPEEDSIGETGSGLGENESEVEVDHNGCNAGWADAMARVLKSKKPKKSRSIILSRAKKLNENAKSVNEKASFEARDVSQEVSSLNEQHPRRKREMLSKCRVKPSIGDRDRERRLNRIATRGMVQLFNAVRQHQQNLDCQVKERKKDKLVKSLDKRAFLDILMGHSQSESLGSSVKLEADIKEEGEEQLTWPVLHDDFMIGTARLKDWDKMDSPT